MKPRTPHVNVAELNAHWVQHIERHSRATTPCRVCGRILTEEKSVERGVGPCCHKKTLKVDTRTGDLFA